MNGAKLAKSTQQQAVASWINYLNQVRLNDLMECIGLEQENLSNALETLKDSLDIIGKDIVNNGAGRGGQTGMHGFIAEVAECGFGNARKMIEGEAPIYEWINDNGPEDLRRGAELIQQKFVNSGDHLSLAAIKSHLEKYPDFVRNGGKYQIPTDHYKKIQKLLSISEDEANKMGTQQGDFSLKQWKEVHAFAASNEISMDSIEPSALEYKDVQKNTYRKTFSDEGERLKGRNQERVDAAYEAHKPSAGEGAKAAAGSALIEGGFTLATEIIRRIQSGKQLKDFDEDDWKEIAQKTGIGTAIGGFRGGSIYLLTNYTATPASVASGIVTASVGVASQANQFRNGTIDEETFILNSEMLCMDASVSALSSLIGQALIPAPVLGAVIGNAVGTMMYQIVKDNLSANEQKIMEEYLHSIQDLREDLKAQYQSVVEEMNHLLEQYMEILDRAFAPDIRVAFDGSIQMARLMGVPEDEILDSKEKVAAYFM